MLIFVILALIAIISIGVLFIFERIMPDGIETLLEIGNVTSVCIFVICGFIAFICNVTGLAELTSKKETYSILIYQLENGLYENENGIGKYQLYDQIMQYNSDVAKGKAMQHDIWLGAFYPNIYDELELIELN